MPFYFFGVYQHLSKYQEEVKIIVQFKEKLVYQYKCRRSHKASMEDKMAKNMWRQEKECQMYNYEKRGHKQAREKLRVIIKCPACFERIFPIGAETIEGANYDD